MAWVYILKGKNGRLYVGSTGNLQQRLLQHQQASVHTTKRMLPVELIATREFNTISEAATFERFIKSRKNPKRILWHMHHTQSSPA